MSDPIIRYVPGRPIDTRQILEVVGLPRGQWGPIREAYPEINTAFDLATFSWTDNVTIFVPSYVPGKLLQSILAGGGSSYYAYPHPNRTSPNAALVHVVGGYVSLHIYRLRPQRRR